MYARGKARTRCQENAYYTRSFVVDIDVRDEPGHFTTKPEALAGLDAMIAALEMPRPIVVDSGRGYHCYWPMAEGIPSSEWRAVAKKFLSVAQVIAPEVVADGSRVADTAGLLRIPGAYNTKCTPPFAVRVVQWYDEYLDLGEFKRAIGYEAEPTGASGVSIGDTSKPVQSEPEPLQAVAKQCNWVKHYLTHMGDAGEPEWYAILGIVKFVYHDGASGLVEGEAMAHMLSRGHASYTPESTARKYAQVTSMQSGPTLCDRFATIAPDRCKGCPFFGGVKTPIQVARLDRPATEVKVVEATVTDDSGNRVEETVTIPIYPKPYFRGEEGGVYTRVPGEEGGFAKIYDYDVYPTRRFRTESVETEQMEIHFWLPHDGLRKVRLPTEILVDHKKLGAFLAGKGMITEYNKSQGLAKYMTHYARYLQQQCAAETEFSRLGWREVNTSDPKFVVGNGYFDASKTLKPGTYAAFLKTAARAAACTGSIDEWKKAFSVYADIPDSEAFQMAALLGFAAPLLALTEYSGVLYNIVGHSAAGKSTALKFMSSVWGQPNSNHILHTDTPISIFNMIGYLSSIPVAFDEVTKMSGDAVSDFVLSFTSGRGKMRAMRNGENRQSSVEWDTIVCSTSNTSLYDKLATSRKGYSAEAMRVFEVNVSASRPEHKPRIDEALRTIRDNFGHAGREYIQFVIPRMARIRAAVDAATDKINGAGAIRNEERFWAALLACVQVGGTVARHLGLHTYDVERIIQWAQGSTSEARESVRTTVSDPVTIIGEFCNANVVNLIRAVDGEVPMRMDTIAPRVIKGRLEYEGEKPVDALLSIQAVKEYCKDHSVDSAWLRRELKDMGILTQDGVARRLASGTKFHNPSVRVWRLDLTHPKMSEALDAPPE